MLRCELRKAADLEDKINKIKAQRSVLRDVGKAHALELAGHRFNITDDARWAKLIEFLCELLLEEGKDLEGTLLEMIEKTQERTVSP